MKLHKLSCLASNCSPLQTSPKTSSVIHKSLSFKSNLLTRKQKTHTLCDFDFFGLINRIKKCMTFYLKATRLSLIYNSPYICIIPNRGVIVLQKLKPILVMLGHQGIHLTWKWQWAAPQDNFVPVTSPSSKFNNWIPQLCISFYRVIVTHTHICVHSYNHNHCTEMYTHIHSHLLSISPVDCREIEWEC